MTDTKIDRFFDKYGYQRKYKDILNNHGFIYFMKPEYIFGTDVDLIQQKKINSKDNLLNLINKCIIDLEKSIREFRMAEKYFELKLEDERNISNIETNITATTSEMGIFLQDINYPQYQDLFFDKNIHKLKFLHKFYDSFLLSKELNIPIDEAINIYSKIPIESKSAFRFIIIYKNNITCYINQLNILINMIYYLYDYNKMPKPIILHNELTKHISKQTNLSYEKSMIVCKKVRDDIEHQYPGIKENNIDNCYKKAMELFDSNMAKYI